MKATDLLKDQHKKVDELFERIPLADSEEIGALRDELVAILVAHSAIEEEIFYPASQEVLGASSLISASYEEHALVHVMLQKLLSAEPGDETFHARLGVLKELVRHHIQEEERELFPQIENAMGEERLEELGARLSSRFAEVREGDVEERLIQAVAKSMPAVPGRRPRAVKATPRKAAAKRPPAKRASTQRGEAARGAKPTRGAPKGRRGAATGRKKAAETVPSKTGRATSGRATSGRATSGRATSGRAASGRAAPGRAAPARKTTRPAKTGRTGRKGGRTSSASAR